MMNLFRVLAMAILVQLAPLAVAADWWQENPLSMPTRPTGGSAALQNPPVFSWPLRYAATGYEVRLVGPGGTVTYPVVANWMHPNKQLAPGSYRWQVRALGGGAAPLTDWSDERGFMVAPSATVFVGPDVPTVWSKAAQASHPRGFPKGAEWVALKAAFGGDRAAGVSLLKGRVGKLLGASLIAEPSGAFNAIADASSRSSVMRDLQNALNREQEAVLGLGMLWQLEQNRSWLNEAKRRVLNLAAWNPTGSSGLSSHNQATRTILLTVAVGYDWFYNEWTADERFLLLSSIRIRFSELQAAIVGSNTLLNNPYSPWASYTLGYLTAVAPLVAGDLPEAKTWFANDLGLYTAIFPSWSGDDGGYANGTTYGVWDVPESIVLWDLLRWATGFDLYRKPAISNFGRFMTYFQPPAAPEGLFGDGAETRMASSIARYGKSFVGRGVSPLGNWYSRQLFGEDKAAFSMLMTPPATISDTALPPGTPNSVLFPSVGWVAMHSSLAERSRYSVYFKSSPYGSFNHSHADQNSFVIHGQGQVIAMDSGVYDYYNSPHWRDWYKQTRAHNAITFDGGIGQSLGGDGTGNKGANGKVLSFVTTEDYDIVQGDATAAYGGALSLARRWVVLLRPDTVVIVDRLTSSKPRSWEWNFHAPVKPVNNNGVIEFGGVQTSCMRVSSPANLVHGVSEGYQPAPTTLPPSDHFWSRHAYAAPSVEGLFMTVLDLGCNAPPPSVVWNAGKASVTINGRVIAFSGSDVTVK